MYLIFLQFFICFTYLITGFENVTENKNTKVSLLNSNNTLTVPSNKLQISNSVNIKNTEVTSNKYEDGKKIKKRRKGKKKFLQQRNKVNSTTMATPSESVTTHKTKKRRKKRRRKKQNQNNILEITTARIINNNTISLYDESIADLIQQLNRDPQNEFSFKIAQNQSNKTDTSIKKRNRCSINNGGCSQICKKKGKRKCFCLKGFNLAKNRKRCVDINECKVNNGGCKEICRNTLGSYYCDCTSGFRISNDLKSCQDINECYLRNGHGPCQDTCINTHGSYICDCSRLNGTRLGEDKHTCQDIDDCDLGNPGCSHICINTRIGAFCACPEGMELMTDYKTCQDIDECEDTLIRKSCSKGCINTVGSYYCEDDFQSDQANRTKIPVCPPLEPPEYGFITCQRNSSLPYDSFTKNGKKIIVNSPGTKCQLACPTGFKLMGDGRFVCGISGQWITRKGFCLKSPHPKLECPEDQTLKLEGRDKIQVNFPQPRTNIKWKIVQSYPKWAKNLNGKLGIGHHRILFSVTDPATKLSSSCSFSIIINK